jgi:RNA polymerase sigma-70 factor (ECF subfamily)
VGDEEAALAGDGPPFGRLVEPHRRELQLHCYRMVGSIEDSEDLVQETFLRAWRGRDTFEGRSTFRAWLYRIATNACLDFLDRRPRRVLPYDVAPPADPDGPLPSPGGFAWLEPYPDHLLESTAPRGEEPDAVVVAKEDVELAFLAAIQHLPPRQRAVLILRDVLDWSAHETAALLEASEASVKSALQRARSTLRERLPARGIEWTPDTDPSDEEEAVLRRYMEAHERRDPAALAAVLREDVRVSFPPLPLWSAGRDAFIAASRKHAAPGEHRFLPSKANRQPAVAIYVRPPGETRFRPVALEVLCIEEGRVAEIVDFSLPGLFAAFGLPPTL